MQKQVKRELAFDTERASAGSQVGVIGFVKQMCLQTVVFALFWVFRWPHPTQPSPQDLSGEGQALAQVAEGE